MKHVVVAGGSVAAVTTADALRQVGFEGTITLLSDEPYAPYSRPPLSKGVLKGTETVESTRIATDGIDLELRLGTKIVGLDHDGSRVLLEDGSDVAYDGLVIATGARARTLLGPDSTERVIRNLDDALSLQGAFQPGASLTVIGGGFLGMELASTAHALGLRVTVVDMLPHLERQFGVHLARHMTAAARERGVDLIHSPSGVKLIDDHTVQLGDGGETIESDFVVTAIGDTPNIEWLGGLSGVTPMGVSTDSRCRVASNIVAAGDVAIVDFGQDNPRRTPHWGSAIDQAHTAAAALVRGDEAAPYQPRPYFWTEQWDLDMRICGTIADDAEVRAIEGSLDEGSAVLQYLRNDTPVAAVSVNRRMPIPRLRKLASGE